MKEFRVKDAYPTISQIAGFSGRWRQILNRYGDLMSNLAEIAKYNFANVVELQPENPSHVVNGHILTRVFSIQVEPVYKEGDLYGLVSLIAPRQTQEAKAQHLFIIDKDGEMYSPELERISDQDERDAAERLLTSLTLDILEN